MVDVVEKPLAGTCRSQAIETSSGGWRTVVLPTIGSSVAQPVCAARSHEKRRPERPVFEFDVLEKSPL
jgi:hypothetical protein